MKKKSSIIKLCIIGVVLIIGLVLSFCHFELGLKDFNSFSGNIKLGLDLKGGYYAEYVAMDDDTDDFDSRMDGTVTSLQALLVDKGYTEAVVTRQGPSGIRVEIPDVDDPTEFLSILGEPAELEFRLADKDGNLLQSTPIITGDHVVSADAVYYEDKWSVSLRLNTEGTRRFSETTANNIDSYIDTVIIINGEERSVAFAKINEAIPNGQAMISGNYTQKTAEDLANQIMSGTFAVTLQYQKGEPISPTLGEGAMKYGLIAGAIGLVLVMIFMCLNYRVFGAIASMALGLYAVMMLFLLSVIPLVQLTLPGIAGVLLSIGMAIDGNVIIYERIKDEYANGKSILSASHYGYRKSVGAILDGNITTIIAAIILYIFGTGSVQGFALTLFVGIALALFSSLVVTRGLIKYVIAINSTNPNLYNLKRGKDYISLSADMTAENIQAQLNEEERIKKENKAKKTEKKKIHLAKGGKSE